MINEKNILLVVASIKEAALITEFDIEGEESFYENQSLYGISIDLLISGVGPFLSGITLMQYLNRKQYDFIIHAGIAGRYSDALKNGDVVVVGTEQFALPIFENESDYSTSADLGFFNGSVFPFTDNVLINSGIDYLPGLKKVRGLTSAIAFNSIEKANKINARFKCDIESMEGASVFYVCLSRNIPFVEIRSISNRAGDRNYKNWDIEGAAKNLKLAIKEVLKS